MSAAEAEDPGICTLSMACLTAIGTVFLFLLSLRIFQVRRSAPTIFSYPSEVLFKECSHYVELVSSPDQLPQILGRAMRAAIARRGVAVVVVPGIVAISPLTKPVLNWSAPSAPSIRPSTAEVAKLANLLNWSSRVTLLCGAGCKDSHAEVIELARKLQAPIVHALRGKAYIEYDNPFDVGMTGLIGFSSGYSAMKSCDMLLMLGTDFPYRQFYPEGVTIAQVDIRALPVAQLVVGTLLLLFGMPWLRKAVLRAAGILPMHDEAQAFARETEALRRQAGPSGRPIDAVAFATAFKIVMLEGIEVVFIVIAIGAGGRMILPASIGAGLALLLVVALGFWLHRPLARVPVNALKFGVGVMLAAFGAFWVGEGIGLSWPGEDWAILALIGVFVVVALAMAHLCRHLRKTSPALPKTAASDPPPAHGRLAKVAE